MDRLEVLVQLFTEDELKAIEEALYYYRKNERANYPSSNIYNLFRNALNYKQELAYQDLLKRKKRKGIKSEALAEFAYKS